MTAAETLGAEVVGIVRLQARCELARRAAERGDVLEWGRLLFPGKFPLPFCPDMHQYFVDIMDERLTGVEAPRGHAKTTVKCFLIPMFLALARPGKYRHFLFVQATEDKALDVSRSIKRELEENEAVILMYGRQQGERWTDSQFVLRNGEVFSAIGAGQSIRGINYRNKRPDYVMVDDLYDFEDIDNPNSTKRKTDWFWGDLFPATAQYGRCSVHVQGTAINKVDLLEELKGKEGCVTRSFHAVTDWDAKAVLWPALKTFDQQMEARESMGSARWFREYQNVRRDDSISIVKAAWIKLYDPAELNFSRTHILQACVLGVDPSIGAKLTADYTGMALDLHARHTDATSGVVHYVESVVQEHLSLDARIKRMEEIAASRPSERRLTKVRIEGIAGFKDFVAEARRRTSLPIEEVSFVKDKISTLESKSHFFENGKVFLSKRMEPRLLDETIHQLTTNHPAHDDVRDALLLSLEEPSTNWAAFV